MKKSTIVSLTVILISFGIAFYYYPKMPEQMASHWNAAGEVDGYMFKFWGIFLVPIISVGFFLLFLVIPRIDPLKENIEKFRKYYDGFIVLFLLFFLYLYLITIFWNLGYEVSINKALVPALGILFYYIGIMTENAKRNWFIGIRTPWTLNSEAVWDRTHKIGGRLFKIAGVIAVLGAFFGDLAIWFVLIPVISIAIFTIVYSYFEYQKEVKVNPHASR